MIPHIQINGQSQFLAVDDGGIVAGFIGVEPNGVLRFRGGTPWAPVDAPDAIEVIGAQMRQQFEAQRREDESTD